MLNKYWTKTGYYEAKKMVTDWEQLHREDGPAVEVDNGSWCWIRNGLFHREDGPAAYNAVTNRLFWYLHGEDYILEEFIQKTPYLKTDGERTMFYLKWK